MFSRKLPPLPERLWLTLFVGSMLTLSGFSLFLLWGFTGITASKDMAMPPLYGIFLKHRDALFVFPIPWLGYGVYLIWKGAAPRQLIAFSSSLIVALLTLAILYGSAMALPWISRQVLSISNTRGEYLTDEQRAFAFQSADRADAEAHMILFRHYAFMRQTDLAEYYLNRAADLGNVGARKVLEQREREYGLPPKGAAPVPTTPTPSR